MPSPAGHALAGVIVAYACAPPGSRPSTRTIVTCAALACAPDLDLLLATHRTATHSVVAVATVFAVAWLVAPRHVDRRRVAATSALAYATHLLLDLFGVDWGDPAGLQLFWPWIGVWYQSPWPLFLGTERRALLAPETLLANGAALAWELLVLMPLLALTMRWRTAGRT